MTSFKIIQGGMGAGVSNWRLARTVSLLGQLGVVSGTALDLVLARRLQLGDPGGEMRRAMEHFPVKEISQRVCETYYISGGKPEGKPFRPVPMPAVNPAAAALELLVLANFVEVWLAKEGHSGLVGINLLEKIQVASLPAMYGAMLAGVDYVLMGAGIPRSIPRVLDQFSEGLEASIKLTVVDAKPEEDFLYAFNPAQIIPVPPLLKRPQFLAIVSSATLAMTLARKSEGKVDGFVVEGSTAGGHNAPPRGAMQLNERGEPVYSERDIADLEKIRDLGLPFWLAGSQATHGMLQDALSKGAEGVQVGTAFAFCEESGIDPVLKSQVLEQSRNGKIDVFTDPRASPTGFPFKVVVLEGTLSEADVCAERDRICDLGYLRHLYRKPDGAVGYRCPGEPLNSFLKKGGSEPETLGRKCVCNGLMANIGLGQTRLSGYEEKPLITAGDDAAHLARFLKQGTHSYSAADVVRELLGEGEHRKVSVSGNLILVP